MRQRDLLQKYDIGNVMKFDEEKLGVEIVEFLSRRNKENIF